MSPRKYTGPNPRGPNKYARGESLVWLREAVRTAVVTECQYWPFSVSNGGAGTVVLDGKKMAAYAAALKLAGRDVPVPPLECRHTCNVRACVNFLHIIPGTHAQNMADKKGHGTFQQGASAPWSRLTEADVRAIRASSLPQAAIGKQFGISQSLVCMIRTRKRWASLGS